MHLFSRLHKKSFLRFIPFVLLIILILIVYFTNFYQHLSFTNLKQKQAALKAFVDLHPFLSPLLFVAIYTLSVCLIIPDSTILTLIAGFVFPLPLAVSLTTISETLGAILFFLIIKNLFSSSNREKKYLKKLKGKFNQDAASYLLFLRFSHILPFWFINALAAYFLVPMRTFIWTTFLGVLPFSYLLSDAGKGLAKIFATESSFNLRLIFTTEMKITLFFISLLALIPIVYKHWFKASKNHFGKK